MKLEFPVKNYSIADLIRPGSVNIFRLGLGHRPGDPDAEYRCERGVGGHLRHRAQGRGFGRPQS